jgi:transcriptional regulator with XRE-family HTH domain
MTTHVHERAVTASDELPISGLLCKLTLAGEQGRGQRVSAYVMGGGRAELIHSLRLDSPDAWYEMTGFLTEAGSTSTSMSFVRPIDRDSHPTPELSERVRRLHDMSGLTWDQLARAFGVSRRAVHSWAGGGRLNARNAERLEQVEQVVSDYQAENPESTRDRLLRPRREGRSIFQLLVQSAHERSLGEDIVSMLASSGEGPNVVGRPAVPEGVESPESLLGHDQSAD